MRCGCFQAQQFRRYFARNRCAHLHTVALALLSFLPSWNGLLHAQEAPTLGESAQVSAPGNVATNCIDSPPLIRWQDYDGPFAKVAGVFARKLERKSVHPPHYKPGAVLCTLDPKDKFLLFVHSTFDPVTFLSAGFNAGLDQAQDTNHSFGQGAAGYGKRFGAAFADQASSEFFKDFAYPTLFSEDPRYYRLAHGSTRRRLAHALQHAFVANRENGTRMFNASEWLGTLSSSVLSNTYHPDNQRGVGPTAQRVGFAVLQDMGFDVLREFWPEVSRKLRLPFRDHNDPVTAHPAK